MYFFRTTFVLAGILCWSNQIALAAGKVVELKTNGETYVGQPVVHNDLVCWLTNTEGRYSRVVISDILSASKLPQPFHVQSAVGIRSTLKSEFSNRLEVVTRGSFVVAGPPGRTDAYADQLDRLHRFFSRYTSVRRLPVTRPEYPLVVIIFPERKEFIDYVRSDDIPAGPFLRGYYHPLTNRVTMFESDGRLVSGNQQSSSGRRGASSQLPQQAVATLLHEGIHQLAFNQGLHSRIGQNPRWIVEGLAMMLEANEEMNQTTPKELSNLNVSRLLHFQKYRAQSREENIADFIADDERYFKKNVLDAYSQAWALSYFLSEQYSAGYAKYLKRVAERDPLDQEYSGEERLKDFASIFGKDLPWLEVKFLRFIDGLKAP